MNKESRKFSFVALLLCNVATPAVAQNENSPGSEVPAKGAGGTSVMGDIIVTANKREQSLRDVPASISVVRSEQFSERNVQQLSDLPTLVPGFEFVRAPANTPGLTFRGLGPQAGNVAFDSAIGMFVDGVFLGNTRLYNQTLFDVSRAEFIKGSQSALLGKNSTVGALSIVNTTPRDYLEGKIEGGAEVQRGGGYGEAAVSLPVAGGVSLRLSGRYSHQEGYIKNVTTGLKGPVATDWGGRAQLLIEPEGSELSVRLSYQHTDNKLIGSANQCVAPGLLIPGLPGAPYAPGSDISVLCGDGAENDVRASFSSDPRLHDGDDSNRTNVDIAHATLNYDFGPVTLTSITAGAWADTLNASDFDFDNKDFNVWVRDENYSQFTQELRLTSNDTSAAIQYIVGLFYIDSKFNLDEDHVYEIPDFVPDPTSPLYGQLFNGSYTQNFDQRDKTISAFSQVTWKPSSQLTFNVGARYSHDRKVVNFGREADLDNLTLWNTVLQAPFAYQRLTPVTDNLFSGSIAAQYEFSREMMLYASYSRGGKAGGYGEFAGIAADPNLPTSGGLPQGNPNVAARVKPERANAYEVGIKSSLFDRAVSLDLAAFWTDIYNLQQLTFTGQFIVTNDRVRSRGIETTFEIRPVPQLALSGSATYAEVKDLNTGLDSANAPRFSGGASIVYEQPLTDRLNLSLRGSIRHRSSKFNQLGEGERDDEFTTFGFGARVDSDAGWFVNASVENAFNAKGANFGFPGPDPFVVSFKTLEPLRRITLSVGTEF